MFIKLRWAQGFPTMALAILSVVATVTGAEYFVAPGGDDAGPDTAEKPWKTLAKVNDTVQAGDISGVHGARMIDLKRGDAVCRLSQ